MPGMEHSMNSMDGLVDRHSGHFVFSFSFSCSTPFLSLCRGARNMRGIMERG